MKLSGWGNFPIIDGQNHTFCHSSELQNIIKQTPSMIARGNARSYGDSALSSHVISTLQYHYFLEFDLSSKTLTCQAGVLLADIIDLIVAKGLFLKVTPGTKYITLGGAVASDVHGKNHHHSGSFSESVLSFRLLLADGSIVECSKQQNCELFFATCGGMGLTGVILDVTIELMSIASSDINQTTIKTANLKQTFDAFEKHHHADYSVAWIDCLANTDSIGRGLIMLGEHNPDSTLPATPAGKKNLPFYLPSCSLNHYTVKAFNYLYYHRYQQQYTKEITSLETFFYPLDGLLNWNRIYGRSGFVQYQCVLPLANSFAGLKQILKTISASGKGSFLAVLKLFGEKNNNFLSFPMQGYTLALDFKIEPGLMVFLRRLDAIVANYGGRIYLAKDARVSSDIFQQGYPDLIHFKSIRKKYLADRKFNSLQSVRLEI